MFVSTPSANLAARDKAPFHALELQFIGQRPGDVHLGILQFGIEVVVDLRGAAGEEYVDVAIQQVASEANRIARAVRQHQDVPPCQLAIDGLYFGADLRDAAFELLKGGALVIRQFDVLHDGLHGRGFCSRHSMMGARTGATVLYYAETVRIVPPGERSASRCAPLRL